MIQDPAAAEADVEHVAQPAESPAAPVLEHVTGGRLPCRLQQTSVGDPWTLTGALPDSGACTTAGTEQTE